MMMMITVSDDGAVLPDVASKDREGPMGVLPDFSLEKASTNNSKKQINKHIK